MRDFREDALGELIAQGADSFLILGGVILRAYFARGGAKGSQKGRGVSARSATVFLVPTVNERLQRRACFYVKRTRPNDATNFMGRQREIVMLSCSIALARIFCPAKVWMTVLLPSLLPEVKMISLGLAPMMVATS